MRACALLATVSILCATLVTSAVAGARYGARYSYEPEESYGYLPPAPPTAFVFRRHTDRCDYPNGFNATDFVRNIGGIPRSGDELLATGCASFEPFSD